MRHPAPAGAGHRPGQPAWEARRRFRHVAEALAAAGAVQPVLAGAIAQELDDALAVRGLVEPGCFAGRDLPVEALAPAVPLPGGAEVWLEAEIERHLDLLADHDPGARAAAGERALGILAAPVRALVAAGALDPHCPLLAELGASLAEAGFLPDRPAPAGPGPAGPAGGAGARPEWVRFLREVRAVPDDPAPPPRSRSLRQALGTLGGQPVTLTGLEWSFDRLRVQLALGRRPGQRPDEGAAWSARARGERGRLHLGQPVPVDGLAPTLELALRPGLEPAGTALELRITRGGQRIEATVGR